MTLRLAAVAALVASFALGGVGAASTTSPTTSMQPIVGGPIVPGVCMISPEALLTGSKVGQAANTRLKQLAADAEQQLQADQKSLNADAQALEAQSKTLPPDQMTRRQTALAEQVKSLRTRAELRNRELEATRIHAVQRISQYAQPLIAAAFAERHCGLLLRRDDVLGGNMSNDLTMDVARRLDAQVSTITFDLEAPPAPGGASGA